MNTHAHRILATAALALTTLTTATHAAVGDNPIEDAVHKHLEPLIDAGLIPGAVVAVRSKGVDSYYTLGTLDFDSDEEPSFDTLYEIGSISKVFTGVLFADAVRRGEVRKDTPIDELLPEGVNAKDFEGKEVELWHLTTHTSGWPTAPSNLMIADGEDPFANYTKKMLFRYISDASPVTEPGTKFEYSNLAVGLLGTLISDRIGADYESAVTDRVFKPLGIDDIQITLDEDDLKRLAPATSSGRHTKHWSTMGPLDGAGMWVASAQSMLKFANANLEDGEGEIYESLTSAREPMADSGFGKVCFGWMLAGDGSTYWHNGMTGGYSSYMAVNRMLETAVVVLTNGATFGTTAAGEKLFQQLVGMNPDPIDLKAKDPIDPDYGQQLAGTYKCPYFEMEVTVERGGLFAKITGQSALILVKTDTEHRFRYEAVDAELGFDVPEEGKATRVTLYQNGQVIPCDRVED